MSKQKNYDNKFDYDEYDDFSHYEKRGKKKTLRDKRSNKWKFNPANLVEDDDGGKFYEDETREWERHNPWKGGKDTDL